MSSKCISPCPEFFFKKDFILGIKQRPSCLWGKCFADGVTSLFWTVQKKGVYGHLDLYLRFLIRKPWGWAGTILTRCSAESMLWYLKGARDGLTLDWMPRELNLPTTGKEKPRSQDKMLDKKGIPTRSGWQSLTVWRAKAKGGRLCGTFTTCIGGGGSSRRRKGIRLPHIHPHFLCRRADDLKRLSLHFVPSTMIKFRFRNS